MARKRATDDDKAAKLARDRATALATIDALKGVDHERVFDELGTIGKVRMGKRDGWTTMSFLGLKARAGVAGWPILNNWAAMARRDALKEA